MGLKVFSNLVIKKPSQCSRRVDRKPTMGELHFGPTWDMRSHQVAEPSDLWGLLVVDIVSLRNIGCWCHSLSSQSTRLIRSDPVPIKKGSEECHYLDVP